MKRQLLARIETLERSKSPMQPPKIVITFVGRNGELSPAYVLQKGGLVLASGQQVDGKTNDSSR